MNKNLHQQLTELLKELHLPTIREYYAECSRRIELRTKIPVLFCENTKPMCDRISLERRTFMDSS
jgi:hypothetical protein